MFLVQLPPLGNFLKELRYICFIINEIGEKIIITIIIGDGVDWHYGVGIFGVKDKRRRGQQIMSKSPGKIIRPERVLSKSQTEYH